MFGHIFGATTSFAKATGPRRRASCPTHPPHSLTVTAVTTSAGVNAAGPSHTPHHCNAGHALHVGTRPDRVFEHPRVILADGRATPPAASYPFWQEGQNDRTSPSPLPCGLEGCVSQISNSSAQSVQLKPTPTIVSPTLGGIGSGNLSASSPPQHPEVLLGTITDSARRT